MGNTGSKGISNHETAILQLKLQRDNVYKCIINLNDQINADLQLAKSLIKDKDRNSFKVKLLLRKKKRNENLIMQLNGQLENLESLIDNIELKLSEVDYLKVLKTGNTSLKSINREIDSFKIDDLIDDTIENIQYQNEVNDKLSTVLNDTDDVEIDAELKKLEMEMMPKKDVTEVGSKLDSLPSVPSNIPQKIQPVNEVETEERENDVEERVPLAA